MKLSGILGLIVTFVLCVAWGCASDEPEKIEPAQRGQRGETCLARNDCLEGLACIAGTCSRNDFDIDVSAKHCDRVDCEDDEDCCGDKLLEAPAKCDNRVSICQTPTLPGCIAQSCVSDETCGQGTCGMGSCSRTGAACTTDEGCPDDVCLDGFCTISLFSCQTNVNCLGASTCLNRFCNCQNPEFNPDDPICSDEDCVNICNLRCESEACVVDTSCETDIDCFDLTANICDDGRCVECLEDEDCDEDNDETCERGFCERPCTEDEECPLFHQCDDGECIETGCTSDRECVLAANQGNNPQIPAASDARLSQCLPVSDESDVSVCRVPCENDGECASELQICEEGFCRFIGCETDAECRTFLGIANEVTNEDKPFVSKAVCRE